MNRRAAGSRHWPACWLSVGAGLAALILLAGCAGGGATTNIEPAASAPATTDGGANLECDMTATAGTPASEASMRFLALGDSYTIGESVKEAERWPVQLAALLGEQGFEIGPPQIIAQTGWTTGELQGALNRAKPEGPFELVSLLIGVNNQYRGRPLAEFGKQFSELLARSIELAGGQAGRVLVLSIPDWGVTPFAKDRDRAKIADALDDFNGVAAVESERQGAHFVDVTPESRQAAAEPDLIAGDGLHPSGKMYSEWARLALPAACQALGLSR